MAEITINITVNNASHSFPLASTVQDLVKFFDLFAHEPFALERNGEIVPRTAFDTTPLCQGDIFEVIHIVGGG